MGAKAEATNTCRCDTQCGEGKQKLCCPPSCKLCVKKNCEPGKDCKCTACTCGCQQKQYKQCNESDCAACKVICKADQKCRCTFCDCGCQNAFDKGELCFSSKNNTSCEECKNKCETSKDGSCICKLCSCGCNGVNCQCCRWCNPETRCKGKCDTKEKHGDECPRGMCEKSPGTCSQVQCRCQYMGMSTNNSDQCVCRCRCEQKCPKILCAKGSKSGKKSICGKYNSSCTCECKCNCNAYGKYYDKDGKQVTVGGNDQMHFYGIGQCRFKCTHCGKLCAQDLCRIWLGVIIIVSLILSYLFVMRAMFPEKFHSIMTKIRAAFTSSSRHSGIPPSNLVGDTSPGDMNIDRYPGFRPRAYPGLS